MYRIKGSCTCFVQCWKRNHWLFPGRRTFWKTMISRLVILFSKWTRLFLGYSDPVNFMLHTEYRSGVRGWRRKSECRLRSRNYFGLFIWVNTLETWESKIAFVTVKWTQTIFRVPWQCSGFNESTDRGERKTNVITTSEAFFSQMSLSSPEKVYIFIIKKNIILGSMCPKKHFIWFWKTFTDHDAVVRYHFGDCFAALRVKAF